MEKGKAFKNPQIIVQNKINSQKATKRWIPIFVNILFKIWKGLFQH